MTTKTGVTDLYGNVRKRGSTWSAAGLAVTGDGAVPATTSYDGSYGAGATFCIGALGDGTTGPWYGTIRNVRIGQRQLSASELQAITA